MKYKNAIKRLEKIGFSIEKLNNNRTIAKIKDSRWELGIHCNTGSENVSIIWAENINDRSDAMTDYFGGTEYFKTLKAAINWVKSD